MRSRLNPTRLAPNPTGDKPLAQGFEWRVRLSRLALVGERVWEALLWPFLVVCAFVIISLLELWSVLPPLLHKVLLGAFGLALVMSLLPLFRLAWPTRGQALRRLERGAEIKHRPASSYEDRLAPSSQGETTAIWSAHRARLARIIAKLKPSWPEPRTDRLDPYALRAGLLLILAVTLLATPGSGWDHLRAAFAPGTSAATALLRLDAWVTPPVYTGMAPIVLADGSEPVGAGLERFRALSVPERSELVVRTHSPNGGRVTLVSTLDDGTEAETVQPKSDSAEGLVEFNLKLTSAGTADVRLGGSTIAKWRFELIEDAAPRISLIGNPTTTPRSALRLVFRASDDHGVASAEARFALANAETEPGIPPAPAEKAEQGADTDPLSKPPVMTLQLPRSNAKQVEGPATQDLTAHPWAGLPVRMTLIARDQAGQEGMSETIEFVLPERNFTKPLAKAVVEQRRKLVREPGSLDRVARALDALTLGGERVIDDSVVYLGLRNAYWRLRTDRSPDGIGSVVDQLWHVALRIEEGDLPEAERAMREAQDRLKQALKDNASPDEIQRLMDELRSALSRYLKSLAQQAENKGNLPPQSAPQDGDQLVSQQDLDKLLQNIEDLAKSGSKELAEQMLSELKDILERLQTGTFADDAKQQRMGRIMRDLNDLVGEQQKLLDDTFGAKRTMDDAEEFEVSPPGPPMLWDGGINMAPLFEAPEALASEQGEGGGGEQGGPGGQGGNQRGRGRQSPDQKFGQLGQRQGSLRDKLQNLIDRFRIEGANPPNQFEGAGEAMGEAQKALGENNPNRAVQEQSLALDRLRKGAESLAEQMMEGGEAQAQAKGQGKSGRDPLGRPDRSRRPDLGLSVKIPDQIDIQRAREVLDELRMRLGDPSRPVIELDYLERLIRPF